MKTIRSAAKTLSMITVVATVAIAQTPQTSWADEAKPQVITIQNHLFQPTEIHIPAHQKAVLLIKNLDATPEEFESGALSIEKVIPAKGEGLVHVHAMDHGHYTFVGEYHEKTARGVLIAD
jgi:hypothetical protein